MGRLIRPAGVTRSGARLVPVLDTTVAIPELQVAMAAGRAVMRVSGLIMGDADDVRGMYIAPSGLTSDQAAATDLRGIAGQSVKGDPGNPAWTPTFVIESDGAARYLKITDWTGGTGTKPDIGYIGANGITTKALAPNLNAAKKFGVFSAVTSAAGIATVSFGDTFQGITGNPSIAAWAVPATAVGGVKTTQVAASLSKTGVQIKAEAPALLTQVLTVLAGATVFVIAIEP